MKIKYFLLTAVFGIFLASCQTLDLEPKGILSENEIFGNQAGVTKYFSSLYNRLPIEDFVYYANNGFRPSNSWEAMKRRQQNMSGEFVNTWQTIDNDGFGYWPYSDIRNVNVFINNFPDYKDNFSVTDYNNYMGEAHFIRAFLYFGMVKRYGGIPILTEVQNPLDDLETLMVPRETEYDTWKFVYEDLKFAIDNMVAPSKRNPYRANKYVAAALMNRAMLYAASTAKYGQYRGYEQEAAAIQGFAGMSPSVANEFFQYAYDAGKLVETGGYSLYRKNTDLAENFAQLFLDEASEENIFVKDFDRYSPSGMYLRHTWDSGMLPQPDLSNFVGSQSYPALDMMRLYDFPDIVDANGYPIRYTNRGDIRNGMEPRMRGSMWFNGDKLRDVEFWVQRGNYKTFTWKAEEIVNGTNEDAPNKVVRVPSGSSEIEVSNRILSRNRYGSFKLEAIGTTGYTNHVATTETGPGVYRYQGNHGLRDNEGGENNNLTGGFVRKYVDPTNTNTADYGSSTAWIVFRLAEIYLNMAEVCYELGKETEAFDYIERIRDRAGAKVKRPAIDKTPYQGLPNAPYNSHTYAYSIDASLQFIREERYRELWGENHHWWDIRRWTIADRVRRQYRPRALSCYYVIDENKYIYLDERIKEGSTWNASISCYYEPIPQSQINRNEKLLPQNPLY